MGRFRFRTWYQQYIGISDKTDSNKVIVYRYDKLNDEREPVNPIQPGDEDKTEVQIEEEIKDSAGYNNTLK